MAIEHLRVNSNITLLGVKAPINLYGLQTAPQTDMKFQGQSPQPPDGKAMPWRIADRDPLHTSANVAGQAAHPLQQPYPDFASLPNKWAACGAWDFSCNCMRLFPKKGGSFLWGVLIVMTALYSFGVYIWPPDFWKLPCWIMHGFWLSSCAEALAGGWDVYSVYS